jgi:hypothetical protein
MPRRFLFLVLTKERMTHCTRRLAAPSLAGRYVTLSASLAGLTTHSILAPQRFPATEGVGFEATSARPAGSRFTLQSIRQFLSVPPFFGHMCGTNCDTVTGDNMVRDLRPRLRLELIAPINPTADEAVEVMVRLSQFAVDLGIDMDAMHAAVQSLPVDTIDDPQELNDVFEMLRSTGQLDPFTLNMLGDEDEDDDVRATEEDTEILDAHELLDNAGIGSPQYPLPVRVAELLAELANERALRMKLERR